MNPPRTMRQILLVAALPLLAAVVASVVFAFQLRQAATDQEREVSERAETLFVGEQLRATSEHMSRKLRSYLITGNSEYLADMRASRAALEEDLRTLQEHVADPRERALLREIRTVLEAHTAAGEDLIRERSAGAGMEVIGELVERTLEPRRDRLDAPLQALVTMYQEDFVAGRQSASRYLNKAFVAFVAAAAIGAAIACALAIMLLRTLQRLSARNAQVLQWLELAHRAEEELRALAESMPQMVWTADREGRSQYTNHVFTEFTGRSINATTDGWLGFVHPDDLEESKARWMEAVATGTPYQVEHRLRRADGAYRWYLSRAVPMRDAGGDIVKWFGTSTDVEGLKRAEREAVRAVELRDDFLSVASHELRTPLTSLKLQLELLRRDVGKLTTERPRLDRRLTQVERQVARLRLLNESLLDVVRLGQRPLSVSPAMVQLAPLVREVVDRFEPDVQRAGSDVRLDLDEHAIAYCDPDRVDQVVMNLLSNAVKYGGGRPIEITLRQQDAHAELVVRDHGIGIAPDARDRIFGKFERAVSTQQYGGLGLGLYISRAIVAASGGNITVHSPEGGGAEFVVTLPLLPRELRERERAIAEVLH